MKVIADGHFKLEIPRDNVLGVICTLGSAVGGKGKVEPCCHLFPRESIITRVLMP